MISKRIASRKDGKSSARKALRYGEGLKLDKNGQRLDKSHRTRLGNFGLVEDGVYAGHSPEEMERLIGIAAIEMQSTCDLNTRVSQDNKIAHFVVSYRQTKPSEAVLLDTENSILAELKLRDNHFATFLHNDNGYWHLHIIASRIEKYSPHRGNPLWQDRTIRDRVCLEIEIRHHLEHDNGMHFIDETGRLVKLEKSERGKGQNTKRAISDKAKATEKYSGASSFQAWCQDMRIGDRFKDAKNWQELHYLAHAYDCTIKSKGAGFILMPNHGTGSIQLSKVGLKNLAAKYGEFIPPTELGQQSRQLGYEPVPIHGKDSGHYQAWKAAKTEFSPYRTSRINDLREVQKRIRQDLHGAHKAEIAHIRTNLRGADQATALSIAKMKQVIEKSALGETLEKDRKALRQELSLQGPGNTYREYLVKEAAKGDDGALVLARRYGTDETTLVSLQSESLKLKNIAAITGKSYRDVPRLKFGHQIHHNGTVVFDLGLGKTITDSAQSKKIHLNETAARDADSIAVALRFAASKFGPTLTLTGSDEFKRLAVETAARTGIKVQFTEPALQSYHKELLGSIYQAHQQTKEKYNVTRFRPESDIRIPPPHRRDRLHEMSELTLASESQSTEMLLPKDVSDRLAKQHEKIGNDPRLRRAGSAGSDTTIIQVEKKIDHPISASEWMLMQDKTVAREYQFADPSIAFEVLYIASDGVVLDHGRALVLYPPQSDLNVQVGQKVNISRRGVMFVSTEKASLTERGR